MFYPFANSKLEREKQGGLVVVILGWCLLVVYLAILLDLMPRLSLLKHPLSKESLPSARTPPPRETLMREGGGTRATALFTPTEGAEDRGLEAVQVVMAGDTAGLGGMVAAVNSVMMHTKWPVKFYLATTDDERQHLELWIKSTKLHRMVYKLRTLPRTRPKDRPLRFVKTQLSELFPELEGPVVYLDWDVILLWEQQTQLSAADSCCLDKASLALSCGCLDKASLALLCCCLDKHTKLPLPGLCPGDIWELNSTPMRPDHLGAFSEDCAGPAGGPWSGRRRYATALNLHQSQMMDIDIDAAGCPFTTGVFLANLTRWRETGVTTKLRWWLDSHKRQSIVGVEPGMDEVEAAMLIVFYDRIAHLDPLWHVQHLGTSSGGRHSKQFVERAKLLHWSGPSKPWHRRCAHSELWERYFVPDPTAQFRPARKRG
uniref:Uncharacterized protein n=1 Tax=Timema shepardi TaxID=629360 RepID=A0A7R9AW49_TIMSH|nr:unnamed protein product [Timema shepardi]